jgi:hypothetical protein
MLYVLARPRFQMLFQTQWPTTVELPGKGAVSICELVASRRVRSVR